MRIFTLPALLLLAGLTACSGIHHLGESAGTRGTRTVAIPQYGKFQAKVYADAGEAGWPSTVRVWAGGCGDSRDTVSWQWKVNGVWYDGTGPDSNEYWINAGHSGTVDALARGIDKNGNTCSSPIRVNIRNNADAAPVCRLVLRGEVCDDGGGTSGEGIVRISGFNADGSAVAVATGDVDGDGVPDFCVGGSSLKGVDVLVIFDQNDPEGRSYDPEGSAFTSELVFLNSDGKPVASSTALTYAWDTTAFPAGTYTYKITLTQSYTGPNGEKKKEYVGHVSLLR